MKRTFRKINNQITYEYPANGGGGEGEGDGNGQPMPGDVKDGKPQKSDNPLEELQKMKDSVVNHEKPELTYSEAKEKVGKRIIQDMIRKLVDAESGERKFGRDYLDKKLIARDILVETEIKIPERTYNLGKNPMAFYFDFSGSCDEFCGMFAEITAGLLDRGAITYIGGNGHVHYRIDKAPSHVTENMIENAIRGRYAKGFQVTKINTDIAGALKHDKVQRMLAYTDYDSCHEMVRASEVADLIWFSAERNMHDFGNLDGFKGKFFQALDIDQIKKNLANINNETYEKRCREIQKGREKGA